MAPTTILVTGGTGTLGRLVVARLRERGLQPRVLSRKSHPAADGIEYLTGDLLGDVGLPAAVDGVRTVLHCAGSARGDDRATENLVRAASAAGVRQLVYISVVGADRVPQTGRLDRGMFGYFGTKHAAEQVVTRSGLPWTTLRATQFHDLVLLVARQLAKLPVLPVPAGFRFQPVDPDDVAARLVELALAEPAGLVPDLAGPRIYPVAELIAGYLRRSGRRRPLLPVHIPGAAARAVRAGANLAPDRAVGRRTWEEFLAERVPSASGSAAS